jgi:hypothetical protein
MLMLDKVRVLAEEFDILHFHIDQYHFPLFREMAGRTVTTLHGRQELPDLKSLYIGFSEMPLVSISNDQRRPIAKANFSRPYITEFRRTCTRQNSARPLIENNLFRSVGTSASPSPTWPANGLRRILMGFG